MASIGFSFRTTITPVTAAVTILYLIPLFLIAFGYTTKIGEDAPSIASLEESFPFYPISTLREAIKAMRMANAVNHRVHDQKASRFDWAFTATLIVTAAALIVQFLSSVGLFDGWKASHIAAPPTPTAASSHIDSGPICWRTSVSHTCEDLNPNASAIRAPDLVTEVISSESQARDRMEKFDAYTSIASVMEYVLVDSRKMGFTFTAAASRVWTEATYGPGQRFDLLVLLRRVAAVPHLAPGGYFPPIFWQMVSMTAGSTGKVGSVYPLRIAV